jgi:hypothetical protein
MFFIPQTTILSPAFPLRGGGKQTGYLQSCALTVAGLPADFPLARQMPGRYNRTMSTLQEIEAALETLPKPEQEKLFNHLAARIHGSGFATAAHGAGSRHSGLHAAAWEVSPDFDAPLPDKFWTGRDA